MIDEVQAEIGIAAAVQIGTFLLIFGGQRADLKNIKEWLRSTAKDAAEAKLTAAELKGRVDTLPCERCEIGG